MNDTTSIPDASIPATSPSDHLVIPDIPAPNHGGSPDTVTAFEQLPLDDTLHRGIKEAGFVTPRPVQAATIPSALEGYDVLGLAQTGTGKTAAFVLPILQRIVTDPRRGPRALILAPTRELAMQIQTETRLLAKFTKAKVITVFGGVSAGNQIRGLKAKPDIIVACPGRLLDLFGRGFVDLSHVETLVIDEADHMFDMGFLPDIRKIIAALPDDRQNLMFSATMPSAIRKLANTVLYKPEVFELEHAAPIETIEHALYPVAATRKVDLLLHLLDGDDFKSSIVFSRTKHRAKKLAQQLSNKGHEAVALQGNMTQGQRDRAMKGFREGRFSVLVATDIAARGIDVAGISHVINFDIPNTPDAYTHRIGRTGRAERSGKAYTFVAREDAQQVKAIERKLGVKIKRRVVDGFETKPDDEKRYVHAKSNGKHNSLGGGPSKPSHPQRRSRDSNRNNSGAGGRRRGQGRGHAAKAS